MKRTRLKRKSKSNVSVLQSECDTELQAIGRFKYEWCEVCGAPISCLHHFYPKSTSNRLRYDWDNLIPICNGCHTRHHRAGDPRIHGTVIEKRGLGWYQALTVKKQETIKADKSWYLQIKIDLAEERSKYDLPNVYYEND